jgi:hypothetical protein
MLERLANELEKLDAEILLNPHGNTPTRFPRDRRKGGLFRKPLN